MSTYKEGRGPTATRDPTKVSMAVGTLVALDHGRPDLTDLLQGSAVRETQRLTSPTKRPTIAHLLWTTQAALQGHLEREAARGRRHRCHESNRDGIKCVLERGHVRVSGSMHRDAYGRGFHATRG